jgi:hypothetical protein
MDTNGPAGSELCARQRAADIRVRVALRSIEEAQQLMDQAVQALCSVKGMVDEWKRVGAVYDRVKGAWYVVERRAEQLTREGRLILDREPTEHEAHWAALLDGEQS